MAVARGTLVTASANTKILSVMKNKILILMAASAIVTLSFTFAGSQKTTKIQKQSSAHTSNDSAPAGGFASEDKF